MARRFSKNAAPAATRWTKRRKGHGCAASMAGCPVRVQSFQYSNALKTAHITWDATSLDKWLADPEKLVPDSDMAFQLVRAEERTDIIAYLKQLSGN